jgi:cytochrome c-type biogenesis protein
MTIGEIGIGFAFLAGIASFLSPCVFSLVPAYIGYLGGRSVAMGGSSRDNRILTLAHGMAFVLGFSTVFITVGVAASALGGVMVAARDWLEKIGGVVVVVFGLHMTGILRIPFLEYDLRPQTLPDRRRGFLASYLMGIFFSAGWSPCIGPILGAILTLSYTGGSVSQGLVLLTAYSIGLAIPFLVAAIEISVVTNALKRYGRVMFYAEKVMGVILIIVGVMLFMGRFESLARFGSFLGTYDELALGRVILLVVVSLALLGLIPAFIARQKGRNFLEWWLFGTGLFPVALPMSLMLKSERG